MNHQQPFWNISINEMQSQLATTPEGLTDAEGARRLTRYGANRLRPKERRANINLLLSQFTSPIILILFFAALLSAFLGDPTDSVIILTIVLVSGFLGYWQERSAADAVEHLLALVRIRSAVMRNGKEVEIPVEQIVPGDITILNAGDVIPGDCLLLESKDVYVDEAALTGESYPVEKTPGVLPPETPLSQRTNSLYLGTHVVSGTARALVVSTGVSTEFGHISERLAFKRPETEFEHGVRYFGYFLLEVTLLLVFAIFAINVFLARPVLDSFLFSLALAVGLTPQLLPAIISVNLAHGAQRMAKEKVIVKRLDSIENFGSMNIFCSDKTGTLTEGQVRLHSAIDIKGEDNEKALLYAYLNSSHAAGYVNPIDEAIRQYRTFDISANKKLDEEPYDFVRKRLSILVQMGQSSMMITKGAVSNILPICSSAETEDEKTQDIGPMLDSIQQLYSDLSGKGFRLLGLAYKDMGAKTLIDKNDESKMTFLGFLVLFDPPKPDVAKTISRLRELGVKLKIITGDNRLVAAYVSEQVGIPNARIISGEEVHQLGDAALVRRANDIDVFAEVEPNQKERIILALRKAGNVVGYLGDGINDASALHAADVGISVDNAADVAKEAADIILLEKNLEVLEHGIVDGRKTFANTLKYVFMATSANFGNMFSMAGASLFLPFLPLLPKQILLTNLLTDLPEMTIATDTVDIEMIEKPRRWDIGFIRIFMLVFGPVSSIFDYLTFAVLLFLLKAGPDEFRSGWFVESVVSASIIVLVVRTRRPFFKSRPGKYLTMATLAVAVITILIPYSPLSEVLGFTALPLPFLLALGVIVVLYIASAELAKRFFYRLVNF